MRSNTTALSTILMLMCAWRVSVASEHTNTAPDGFYLRDESGQSALFVDIEDPDGAVHNIPVVPYDALTITRVTAYPVPWTNGIYQVQVNLESSDPGWSKKPIVIVAAGKAVIELSKSGGIGLSGDGPIQVAPVITFEVSGKDQSERMRDKLRELQKRGAADGTASGGNR